VLQNANSAHTPLAMFDQINPASWRIDLNVLAYDITVSALIVAIAGELRLPLISTTSPSVIPSS